MEHVPQGGDGTEPETEKEKRSFFFSQPEVSDKKKKQERNGNQMGLFLQKRFLKLSGFGVQ